MTRPKKEKELSRSNHITLRVSDLELELIHNMAREMNLSLSEFIRKKLLEQELSIQYEVIADIKELSKLTAEFHKIGSNLNQIAKYYNTGGIHSTAIKKSIQNCISQIMDMRKIILEMAGDYHGNLKTYRK